MKRRDFLRTSGAAAGLMGPLEASPALAAAEDAPQQTSQQVTTPPADNRPAEYLRRVRKDPFLPNPPAPATSYAISPMPLAERLRRKIVPQRGFCSTAPGTLVSDALASGNGAMNIELMGDPFAEQILFHHQSLLMPWKRPLEAPNVADIFPQVRQLALEGKTRDAVALALQHMNNSPIKQDTEPHLTVPAFLMQLVSPKAAAVKDYVRTLNFENGEIQVVWTDEHGDWLRRTFASRPERHRSVAHGTRGPEGERPNLIAEVRRMEHEIRNGLGQSCGNRLHRARPGSVHSGSLRLAA